MARRETCSRKKKDSIKVELLLILTLTRFITEYGCNNFYYMVGSACGKMKRILCSDRLPERARMAYLARSGLPALLPSVKVKFFGVIFWPDNKSFIDKACSVKMAGYWPRSFLLRFMDLDFVSVHKNAKTNKQTKKNNLINIQPS